MSRIYSPHHLMKSPLTATPTEKRIAKICTDIARRVGMTATEVVDIVEAWENNMTRTLAAMSVLHENGKTGKVILLWEQTVKVQPKLKGGTHGSPNNARAQTAQELGLRPEGGTVPDQRSGSREERTGESGATSGEPERE